MRKRHFNQLGPGICYSHNNPQCTNPAKAYGVDTNNVKWRRCDEHLYEIQDVLKPSGAIEIIEIIEDKDRIILVEDN